MRPASDTAVIRHILVVDDEEITAQILKESLEKISHCRVWIATNGAQALELLEQRSFDLLITDYKMPHMDGMTLATHVREHFPQIVVIVITAYRSDDLYDRAANIPIHRILEKPVGAIEIRQAALAALSEGASEKDERG